jgi:hypothetical protein
MIFPLLWLLASAASPTIQSPEEMAGSDSQIDSDQWQVS